MTNIFCLYFFIYTHQCEGHFITKTDVMTSEYLDYGTLFNCLFGSNVFLAPYLSKIFLHVYLYVTHVDYM